MTRPYTGETLPLEQCDRDFFTRRFELDCVECALGRVLVDAESRRYVLPIFGPDNRVRGHVLRKWATSPRELRPAWKDYPKADTYISEPGALDQSFYGLVAQRRPVVIVEDQISAAKVTGLCLRAVALLGKPVAGVIAYNRVREIARFAANSPVLIALDPDATNEAFAFVQRYGAAFQSVRVVMLDEDIKDTPYEYLQEVFHDV